MSNAPYIAVAVMMLAAIGVFAFMQYQQAQREAAARTPAAQIGGGVGSLITGIIGLAT